MVEQRGSSTEDVIHGLGVDMNGVQGSGHGGQNLTSEEKDDSWRLKVVRMALCRFVILTRLCHQRLASILTIT